MGKFERIFKVNLEGEVEEEKLKDEEKEREKNESEERLENSGLDTKNGVLVPKKEKRKFYADEKGNVEERKEE